MATSTATTPAEGEPLKLLSLDGGGIKGICSAVVIDELMRRVKTTAQAQRISIAPHPADWFDLAAGTSTGGILAVMLLRIRMTPQQVIESYRTIGARIFGCRIGSWTPPDWIAAPVMWIRAVVVGAKHMEGPLLDAVDDFMGKSVYEFDRSHRGNSPLCFDPSNVHVAPWLEKAFGEAPKVPPPRKM